MKRYSRKQVPLEIRGISREQVSNNATAGHSVPSHNTSAFYVNNKQEPGNAFGFKSGISPPVRSVSPTVSAELNDEDGSHSWVAGSHGWTSTGNTTERSSICTFVVEDEFDQRASQKVRHLFEQIDSLLYEKSTAPHHLENECKQWMNNFPHLRLLGQQIIPPTDQGVEIIKQETPRPSTGSILLDITDQDIINGTDHEQLMVTGSNMRVLTASPGSNFIETEEIFARDGVYEETLAIDQSDMEEENKSTLLRQRRSGIPSKNPQTVIKADIYNLIFDDLWEQITPSISKVLNEYIEFFVLVPNEEASKSYVLHNLNEFAEQHSPIHGPFREESILSTSRLPEKLNTISEDISCSPTEGGNLDGVLTISTKTLILRDQGSESQFPALLPLPGRPGSSSTRPFGSASARVGMTTAMSNAATGAASGISAMDTPSRLTSARVRNTARGRLAPLERTRTPSTTEDERHGPMGNEVLRGKRLPTMNERVLSPPLTFQRNMALPPITLDPTELPRISTARKKTLQSRASSAVHDKELRITLKEREKSSTFLDTRPSTTHTVYRPDTIYGLSRRSSTPMGFSNARSNNSNNQGGTGSQNVMKLNITGSGINPQNDLDPNQVLDDEQLDSVFNTHWGASSLPPHHLRRPKQGYQAAGTSAHSITPSVS